MVWTTTTRPDAAAPKWFPFFIILAFMLSIFLIDSIIFRTSLYSYFIEPNSTAGITVYAPYLAGPQYRGDMKNILVIGDSRVGEGVSAHIMNEVANPRGINFVVIGMAGTTPRVWYYLLRKLDPNHDRYTSISFMTPSMRDDQAYEVFADRILDTSYLAPILGLKDIKEYSDSFSATEARRDARRSILFPEISLQKDILGFLKNIPHRIKSAWQWRKNSAIWISNYRAKTEHMPTLTGITSGHAPKSLPQDISPEIRNKLENYFSMFIEQKNLASADINGAYQSEWFGKIAGLYHGKDTRVELFLIPRGPYHKALHIPYKPNGPLAHMQSAGDIDLLNPDYVSDFEEPQYFGDELHMNEAGREKFSRLLAEKQVAVIESHKP